MSKRTFAGKRCLVTGAASGIGRATALRLATPPLALLVALDLALAAVLAVIGAYALAGILLAAVAALALAALGALSAHGQAALLRDWRTLPRYALWKAGFSLVTLIRREQRWVRTERSGE